MFVALYAASAVRAWWRPWLLGVWIAVPIGAIVLLRGGIFGLADVPSDVWGGLPLTFVLSTVGFAAAFPLAVALALGRRSRMPAIRALSIAYIEVVRGVPIITFLFMAAVMFPLFVPQGFTVDKLLRAQIAFVMVIAAYLAEVVRAGLQAVPKGQYEAAASMGLRFWPATILIVLPQALRATIPALVNTFIAFFKDTSLVAVIGLVRSARHREGRHRRSQVGRIRRRGLLLRRRRLLRVLLCRVQYSQHLEQQSLTRANAMH